MDLRFVTPTTLEDCRIGDLDTVLQREDGFVWLDVPGWSPEAATVLGDGFGFHPVALETCRERNHMPLVHGYADHILIVLHRPLVRTAGHAHLLELDFFVGSRFLVTVHGPANPDVPPAAATEDVRETLGRIRAGRIRPETPLALFYAIASLMALRQRLATSDVAGRVADLERRVMHATAADPESRLEEMFEVRHELLTVRTMATHAVEVLARMQVLLRGQQASADAMVDDLEDMFRRVARMTAAEQEFLAGVIELYRTRTDTKMMIAGERLAVLAAITLPVTAISSVVGMNVIVNTHTHLTWLVALLVLMLAISGILLRYTKRQGWW